MTLVHRPPYFDVDLFHFIIWGIPSCLFHPPQVKQINMNRMLKQKAHIQLTNHSNERQVKQHQRNILMLLKHLYSNFIILSWADKFQPILRYADS